MSGRSTFRWTQWRHYRKARWVVLAAALPVIWACNAHKLEIPESAPTRTYNNVFQQSLNRDVDILFMIDNSRSMLPLQQKLLTNFPIFMQTLQNLPMGLPNVHIAVVSSDMGAGANSVELCNNDQGLFQSVARGTCTATMLNPGEHFISNVNGQANYMGPIENVFSCIAALGQDGCGFEAQLKSVVRALGADNLDGNGDPQPPPENANFLRPTAFLAIILITNEDDCSVPDDSQLFISGQGHQFVSDPEGPLTSYRCNEFGHLCNGMPPPRTMAATFGPGECVPAEEMGALIPVHIFADQVKAVKKLPNHILVAAIAGFPDPYAVTLTPPLIAQDPAMWPAIAHSCMQNSGEYADPGVRLATFVNDFGANGLYLTICAPSFAPALQGIADAIGKNLGPSCITGQPKDKVSAAMGKAFTAGGEPTKDCSVIDHSYDPTTGAPNPDQNVPSCADVTGGCTVTNAAAGCTTCWSLDPGDAMNCTGQHVMHINRPPGPLPSNLNSSVSCSICIAGVNGPGCPCVKPDMLLGC